MRIAFIVLFYSCSMLLLSAAEHLQISRKLYVWHKASIEKELRIKAIMGDLKFSLDCSLDVTKLPAITSQNIFEWLENSPVDNFCMQESQGLLVRYFWVKSNGFALLYLVGRTISDVSWLNYQKAMIVNG